ncbi:YqgQ family protein [Bacillus sp. FJAT-49732]|uniref:YqgQ family protein n=1 Tax=Lederbergia citrisecunda TaxID=2833583 RepID=A0A942YKI0_9BACI|nr:YqgQ family protein [Lederbergia citrisecunda]MBS4199667.1 YqgQ family protein [Lederbergia citrisecunda]
MNTIYDVQQLLKRFGIFVYLGNRLLDLELMEAEVKDLYFSNLIDKNDLHNALYIIRNEMNIEKNRKKSGE